MAVTNPTVTKPGVTETAEIYRYRVRVPGAFKEGSFRTVAFKQTSPKIDSIMGHLKGETTMTLQSLVFAKGEGWDKEKVNAWVKEHRDSLKDAVVESEMRLEALEEWVDAPTIADANTAELMREQATLPRMKDGKRLIYKGYRGEVKGIRENTFEADVEISSGDIDRDREIVDPAGMVVAKPKRVPLVAGHFYGDLRKHIGDAGRPRAIETHIFAKPKWFAGMGNEEADWAWTLVKLGVAAFSIGFIPIEWTDADLSDEKVLEKVRDGKEPLRRYTKWELVEVSQVVVPSNRNAIQRMIDAGILAEGEMETVLAKAAEGDMSKEAQKLFDTAMTEYGKFQKVEEDKKPEEEKSETKPRDAHGCEPGHTWNADTGKCEKDDKKAEVVPAKDENILEMFSDAKPAPVEKPKKPAEELIVEDETRQIDMKDGLLNIEMAIDAAVSVLLNESKRVEGVLLAHKQEIRVTMDVESLTAALKATFEKAFQSQLPADSAAFVSVKDLVPELVTATVAIVRREIEKVQGNVDHYRREQK